MLSRIIKKAPFVGCNNQYIWIENECSEIVQLSFRLRYAFVAIKRCAGTNTTLYFNTLMLKMFWPAPALKNLAG